MVFDESQVNLEAIFWSVHLYVLVSVRVDAHSQRVLLRNGPDVLACNFSPQELQLHRFQCDLSNASQFEGVIEAIVAIILRINVSPTAKIRQLVGQLFASEIVYVREKLTLCSMPIGAHALVRTQDRDLFSL